MNQNEANRTSYDAPTLEAEDPIHTMFRKLNAKNKEQAIRFVEFLKASQHPAWIFQFHNWISFAV